MAGFSVDAQAMAAQLDQLIAEVDGRRQAYAIQNPSYPVADTGQGFAQYGRRIAMMFHTIHEAGRVRTDHLAEACRVAKTTVANMSAADQDFSHQLQGVQ